MPAAHALCDTASGWLIGFLVLFTPWAFGTTQEWSIWTANFASYALGVLLVSKIVIRRREGVQPFRWGEPVVLAEDSGELAATSYRPDRATRWLAWVIGGLLLYTLVSALNARATYDPARRAFDYLGDPVSWLPHSYDRASTLFAFWQYLALACVFWATRDWLLQRTGPDVRQDEAPRWADPQAQILLPLRLRRLLWILCLNGAVLALVGILQRASGTGKLLWILDSTSQKTPENMFGPWSYRGNASQYFNLLWPVCLGFWIWAQERATRTLDRLVARTDGPQILLLPCAIVMAACPMISTSRGGAIVGIAIGVISVLVLLFAQKRQISASVRWITVGSLGAAALAAIAGGWSSLEQRLFRTDRVFPTEIDTGTDDFTLLIRTTVPAAPENKWRNVGGVSGNARSIWTSHALLLGWNPSGNLQVMLYGASVSNWIGRVTTNLPAAGFGGREAQLAVRRGDGLRVFVNGTEIGTREIKSNAEAPSWDDAFLSRFAHVSDPAAVGIALVNFALQPEALATAASTPIPELTATLLARDPLVGDALLSTNELVLPGGVQSDIFARPSDPDSRWIMVRRDASPGVVAIRRELASVDAGAHGPVRVAVNAWNPAPEAIALAFSLDGGDPAIVEIPPRGEADVDLPCRAPHGASPRVLDIYLSDELGNALTDAAPGTQFALRNLGLQPGGIVFARSLDGRLKLGDLSDRLSGRNEVYANARRMAADHVWWGSGPGTFTSLYQFYQKPGQLWAAYAHHDWLETRITFGRIGLALVVSALLLLLIRTFVGRGLPVFPIVPALWWLALGGCLAHAVFDFPFQIYSVFFLFTVLASVLLVVSPRKTP